MNTTFAETLKRLREQKGLSQIQLGKQLFVNNSTVARWENGSRLPDAAMIARLVEVLDADAGVLLSAATGSGVHPSVILVEDSKPILADGLFVLREALPSATVAGFTWPQEALDYANEHRVALAFVDIELGSTSGLDLCRALLKMDRRTSVVFLTAYPDYALDAWDTGACGFMMKPLTPEGVGKQVEKLRYPLLPGGTLG